MKGFRFGFTVILAGAFFLAAAAGAADYSGLWVGTASLNQVGRVNKRIPDLTFNLGLSGVKAEEVLISKGNTTWAYYTSGYPGDNWTRGTLTGNWSSDPAPLGYGDFPPLIQTGDVWRYNATGADPDPDWMKLDYSIPDDDTWFSGQTPLNIQNTTAAYFRKSFDVGDPDDYPHFNFKLLLGVQTDGGNQVSVYLNGVELNLQTSSTCPLGNECLEATFNLDSLVEGENWLAAKVEHTNSETDLLFDLELLAEPPTQLQVTPAPVTVYFRNSFDVNFNGDTNPYSGLRLRLWRDDGIVVYLNGEEILRNNLPKSPELLDANTLALREIEGVRPTYLEVSVSAADLLEKNVLAAEVHRREEDATDADLLFDAELVAVLEEPPTADLISWNLDQWRYSEPKQAPSNWNGPDYDDSEWSSGSAPFFYGDPDVIDLRKPYTKLTSGGDGTLSAWGSNASGQLGLGYGIGLQKSPARVQIPDDPAATWISVAAGESHTVAVSSDGTLWAWGANDYGQLGLGEGAPTYVVTPTQIGTDTDWVSVAAGNFHTVAIRKDATTDACTLWSWGANHHGQLGDETNISRNEPQLIGSTTDIWLSVAAGAYHTVGIKKIGPASRLLYAWGANDHGQLGLGEGASTYVVTPTQIEMGTTWASVAAGAYHTLAIAPQGPTMTSGKLYAWGANDHGQLGLGEGASTYVVTPTQIEMGTTWASVAAGESHTVGIQQSSDKRELYAWGANDYGQLGDGTSGPDQSKGTPTKIGTDTTWASVAAGRHHTLAKKANNTLYSWGANHSGQLGLGDQAPMYMVAPTLVKATWKTLAAGHSHTVGIGSDGTLWAWGANDYGQLGLGEGASTYTAPVDGPTQIGPNQWVAAATGRSHTVAIRSDNTLWSWGANDYGQLGLGPAAAKHIVGPTQIVTTDPPNDSPWVWVAAGANHTVGIRSQEPAEGETGRLYTLWSWGANDYGQLGDGTTTDRYTPKQIGADTDWASVAAGANHTVGIREDAGTGARKLYSWGANHYGQLGDNSTTDSHVPKQIVEETTDWASVAAGANHTVGIRSQEPAEGETGRLYTLWSWGANDYGQLGDNSTTDSHVPKQIGADTDWASVAAGANHTVGIREDAGTGARKLYSWGANHYGQLGDNSTTDSHVPKQIVEETTDWASVAAGANHTVAIRSEEPAEEDQTGRLYTLWSWGANDYGQLGDGTTDNRYTPTQIGSGMTWGLVAAGTWHTMAVQSFKPTVYFRHPFSWDTSYTGLKLEILRDDGAVVYLNGTEIMRTNMPSGTILHTTPPVNAVDPADEGRVIVQEIDLGQMPDLLQTDNVLAVEIHQHPAEVIDAADDVPALTRTAAPLDLRLLLHQDSESTVRLLKEVITMNVYDSETGALRRALLTDHTQIANFRLPAEPEGVRISAVGFDFEGASVACGGAISRSGTVKCEFDLPSDHPTNPFLHRYHPDHDNLDPRYENSAEEAYPITRSITIEFENRYPPDKYEPMRTPPPEWGHTMLGGTYKETIGGLHREEGGIEVSGPFILHRVSERDQLNE